MFKRMAEMGLIGAMTVLPGTLQGAQSEAPARPQGTAPLDLEPPEIGKIFSLDQINAVLSRAVDPALEYVEVEALRLGDLPLQDDSLGTAQNLARTLVWLFAPSPTFAAATQAAPNATDPYRPAPALQANYHASFEQP